MTDNDEDVVLVKILLGLAMNLAVDSKDICVKLVCSGANMGTLDLGMLGIKQVTVDMIAQLARQWKVFPRGLNC